jgi:hypothetical protein
MMDPERVLVKLCGSVVNLNKRATVTQVGAHASPPIHRFYGRHACGYTVAYYIMFPLSSRKGECDCDAL